MNEILIQCNDCHIRFWELERLLEDIRCPACKGNNLKEIESPEIHHIVRNIDEGASSGGSI